MEKSFANLLRGSRLATYDRTIAQVYTSPKKNKVIGDWGFKRNLPTVIRSKYVTVDNIDDAQHQTTFKAANSQVLFLKRWKENFPNSNKPASRSDDVQHHIASMTPAEFKRFLHQSQLKAGEFQEGLRKKELVADQIYDFLKVDFSDLKENKSNGVVGPTYSEYSCGWDYPVEGRVLNPDKYRKGHCIGIGGVVALLPKRSSLGLKGSTKKVRTFYVRHAEMDDQGRPKVEVTLQHRSSATSGIPLLDDREEHDQEVDYESIDTSRYMQSFGSNSYSDNFNHYSNNNYNKRTTTNTMSSEDMMRAPRRVKGPNSEDNITPNPDHMDLMARISGLLDHSAGKNKK